MVQGQEPTPLGLGKFPRKLPGPRTNGAECGNRLAGFAIGADSGLVPEIALQHPPTPRVRILGSHVLKGRYSTPLLKTGFLSGRGFGRVSPFRAGNQPV